MCQVHPVVRCYAIFLAMLPTYLTLLAHCFLQARKESGTLSTLVSSITYSSCINNRREKSSDHI